MQSAIGPVCYDAIPLSIIYHVHKVFPKKHFIPIYLFQINNSLPLPTDYCFKFTSMVLTLLLTLQVAYMTKGPKNTHTSFFNILSPPSHIFICQTLFIIRFHNHLYQTTPISIHPYTSGAYPQIAQCVSRLQRNDAPGQIPA